MLDRTPTIGQCIAHYEIRAKLGEGGMGVVYKAYDTRLERPVALKFLPPHVEDDPETRRRFVQEAKTASALNHPNIVHIYDIATADTPLGAVGYIAMEYVAGEPLSDVIPRKGLPFAKALNYAIQIADALATAHAADIVHRDLKPSNIMVTADGLIKILDFGLAKLTREAGAAASEPTATRTREGLILGTPRYMSPEQAKGEQVDARSDIFSFGIVLYEMFAGAPPFHGASAVEVLSAVLQKDPKPLSQVLESIPHDAEQIVRLALRKDPRTRYQHMADVSVALKALKEDSDSGRLSVEALAPARRRRPVALIGGATVLAVAAIGSVLWWRGTPPRAEPTVQLTRITSDGGLSAFPALSPDGKMMAYASDRAGDGQLDIWLRQINGGNPIRLSHDAADDFRPKFSPDGSHIVFESARRPSGIYMMPALGGDETLVAENGTMPHFSPDGKRLVFTTGDPNLSAEIWVVAVGPNGPVSRPNRVAPGFASAAFGIWTPAGDHLLFVGRKGPSDRPDWWVAPVDRGEAAVQTGAQEALEKHGLSGFFGYYFVPHAWMATQQVVFQAKSGDSVNIWAMPITPKNWHAAGPPRRLSSGAGLELHPAISPAPAGGSGSRMVFANASRDFGLWALPIDADNARPAGQPRRVSQPDTIGLWPHLSANGRWMGFNTYRSGDLDVWLMDLEAGRQTAIATTASREALPKLTHDGSRLAYHSNQQPGIYVVRLPSADAELVCGGCGSPWDWTSDKNRLLYGEPGPPRRIMQVDLSNRENTPLLEHPRYSVNAADLSPDDKWIAFTKMDPPREYAMIAPYRSAVVPENEWITVAETSRHEHVRWSPNGNVLYFRSQRDGHRCIWAQRLDPATKQPRGEPIAVHHVHREGRWLYTDLYPLGLTVARDRLVYATDSMTSEIWMAETK